MDTSSKLCQFAEILKSVHAVLTEKNVMISHAVTYKNDAKASIECVSFENVPAMNDEMDWDAFSDGRVFSFLGGQVIAQISTLTLSDSSVKSVYDVTDKDFSSSMLWLFELHLYEDGQFYNFSEDPCYGDFEEIANVGIYFHDENWQDPNSVKTVKDVMIAMSNAYIEYGI